ncbi:NADPH:quinone reductase [Alicyclobacillus ferrooxydans]|uniref:Quinone oxidoreductase n=1 Tax=Alicyclobacillus ferrooxydans TaxID=471514 RepID=A0A0P9CH68_9BACL|nr:NADPH:quinone reductase [Alicyclobacillus ferrooxydans]KPV45103.1 quinone oxidoreductase [Alicyclobacillus ferrooxydans]
MRAIQMSSFGEADVLQVVDLPVPEPGLNEVRVRLHAAGINPAETYIRTGTYAFLKPDLPYTPGFDGAGIVDKVGDGVTRLRPGDRIFVAAILAKRNTGTYADMVVCDADAVHPLPESLSFSQGAAIGVPSLTAYRALFQRARIQPGETVLVHGASGGVGLLTVQLARAYGAHVIGTAGSADGLALIRQNGAHEVLNHSSEGYLDKIPALTNGHGVDVIVEMLANANLEEDLKVLAQYGRVVVVGSRGSVELTPRLAMIKEADVLGTALWNAPDCEYTASIYGVAAALEAGTITPVIAEEYPLEKAAQAHIDIINQKGAHGKIVLRNDLGAK